MLKMKFNTSTFIVTVWTGHLHVPQFKKKERKTKCKGQDARYCDTAPADVGLNPDSYTLEFWIMMMNLMNI